MLTSSKKKSILRMGCLLAAVLLLTAGFTGCAKPADKSENAGACFTNGDGTIAQETAALCGCYIDEARGTLKVTDIDAQDYPAIVPGLPEGAYHIYDYQFFFRNLQLNVSLRVENYLNANAAARAA